MSTPVLTCRGRSTSLKTGKNYSKLPYSHLPRHPYFSGHHQFFRHVNRMMVLQMPTKICSVAMIANQVSTALLQQCSKTKNWVPFARFCQPLTDLEVFEFLPTRCSHTWVYGTFSLSQLMECGCLRVFSYQELSSGALSGQFMKRSTKTCFLIPIKHRARPLSQSCLLSEQCCPHIAE